MSYLALRHLHFTCVILSGLGFFIRGVWMWRQSPRLQHRLARVLPHIIDTVLLSSGLTLAVWSSQYPFFQNWLTAKFFALLAYILCGTLALKQGRTPAIRRRFFVLALLAYSYLLGAGLQRSPWSFAALI